MNFPQRRLAVCKILIVDDHAETRRMTRLFLNDPAIAFAECADGSQALDCYERFLPDWVLMDWQMPQMDGLAATRQILREFPTARILLVTQFDDHELRRAALEAGAKGFVLKENLCDLRGIVAKHC